MMRNASAKEQKESLTGQAIRGSFWNTSWGILQRIGGAIFTIVLARVLLPEKFGLYNLVLSTALAITIFADKGINETLTRYLSEYIGKKKEAGKYFRYILGLKILFISLFSLLLMAAAYPLSYYFFDKPAAFLPMIIAAFFVFIYSLELFFSGIFFVYKKIYYVSMKESIFQAARITGVLLIFLIGIEMEIAKVFVIMIASSILSFCFVIIKTRKIAPELFAKTEKLDEMNKKRVFNFLSFFTLTSVSYVLLGNIDSIMMGRMIEETSTIGLYKAAFALVASISGLFGFSQVLLPIFVKIRNKNLEGAFNKVIRYTMMLAVPASFGLIAVGDYVLALLYGKEYASSYLALAVLSFMTIFGTQVSLYINLFVTKEKPKAYISALASVIIINIILTYAGIKIFGGFGREYLIVGVALANILSWAVYSQWLMVLAHKKLGIKTKHGYMFGQIAAASVMLGAIYLLRKLIVVSDFFIVNVIYMALFVIAGVAVYLAALYAIGGVTKEDIQMIRNIIFRKY